MIKKVDAIEGPLVDLDLRKAAPPASMHPPLTLGPLRPARESEVSRPAAAARLSPPGPTEPVEPAGVRSTALATSDLPRVDLRREPPRRAPATTGELPLFLKRLPDDEPLVKVGPAPLPPLSVRRKPADPPRSRPVEPEIAPPRSFPFDRDLLGDLQQVEREDVAGLRARARADARRDERPALNAAGPFKRLVAAVIDVTLLGAIGASVLWATLRLCDLTIADAQALPLLVALPLVTFVLLVDLGYLLLFTAAGGQTLGKMAARIRVVGAAPETGAGQRLTIQRAAYRALLTLPSVLALGAGFLPALVGEGRAVHDRIAQTRVVRA